GVLDGAQCLPSGQHWKASEARVEESAATIAQSLSESVDRLGSNTARLEGVAGKTLDDVATLARSFDDHGRMLASASDLLASAQSNLTGTLSERAESIDQLTDGLLRKSEEVSSVLQAFEGNVLTAITSVGDRATRSTGDVAATVRQTADDAITRFEEATAEMRRISDSIRTDLASTREEVRRGVMELPDETRESANAMRRAVSEQINALKDLSRIVEDSGRALDISEGPRAKKPIARTSGANAPAGSGYGAADDALNALAATPLRQNAEPRSVRPEPKPAASKRQASGETFVSDLLRRASEPEDNYRAGNQSNQPKLGENADIASAVDTNAMQEAWRRYRDGERNVFTRQMYTLRGQRTFDDVKRRYETDSAFRASIDQYITDFENLLNEVNRNDRSGRQVDQQLVSDTGKVYTLMAHASGRLR
ncbi:MAG: kinesin, partial [Pseudomonadota bacterium]